MRVCRRGVGSLSDRHWQDRRHDGMIKSTLGLDLNRDGK